MLLCTEEGSGSETGNASEKLSASTTRRFSHQLEELGFSRDTIAILHLVPLVQVAWSDGRVTEAEQSRIRELAALRAVKLGTPGYATLEKLPDERPPDRAFDLLWRVIRAMVAPWPSEKREALGEPVSLRDRSRESFRRPSRLPVDFGRREDGVAAYRARDY